MADIVCLGVLVADLIGRPIDNLPPRGRLGIVDNMSLHIGGCAANTGIGLARLGADVGVLGKVGADGLGEFIINELGRAGIGTDGILRDPTVNTSASMVLVGADGERTFLHHFGGNAKYMEDDVDWAAVEGAYIFDIAGAHIMPGMDGEPMARVMAEAKRRGLITTLDTVWDATGQWMNVLGPVLKHVDYFLPSLPEAVELTGKQDPDEIADVLNEAGVVNVVLKMGEAGCYVRTPDVTIRVPAFDVVPVDGTGSGDAFVAGFLFGLSQGWDLETIARFANGVGALCVTAVGATAGYRDFEATLEFVRTAKTK